MLRTSSFLAIALSATAIVTVPAMANSSQVFGGNAHIVAAQMHPITSVQPSQEIHELGPKNIPGPPRQLPSAAKPVYSGLSPDGKLIPAPGPKNTGSTSIQNAQIPAKDLPPPDVCATHPYLQICHKDLGPSKPPIPLWPPHCEAGGSDCKPIPLPPCVSSKPLSLCRDDKKDDDKDDHHRPVVIFAPQVPVQVPVYVPGPVTYGTSARTNMATGSAVTAQAQPVVTPHCITQADIPALAAGIDELLPKVQLAEADVKQLVELRQTIQLLATDGKVPAARDAEEIAMSILGYQKVWLRCGQGAFDWEPLPVPTQAQATQAK
jgi:hypothetical protein